MKSSHPNGRYHYGDFSELEAEARAIIKAEFAELKEKQIKDLLDSNCGWRSAP
jgi:hypothetical protein